MLGSLYVSALVKEREWQAWRERGDGLVPLLRDQAQGKGGDREDCDLLGPVVSQPLNMVLGRPVQE